MERFTARADVELEFGAPVPKGSNLNMMAAGGSRLFFTALSDRSAPAGEIGDREIFMRVAGQQTVQISASDTATPDNGARYQAASRDGSSVFFTANCGRALRVRHRRRPPLRDGRGHVQADGDPQRKGAGGHQAAPAGDPVGARHLHAIVGPELECRAEAERQIAGSFSSERHR